MQLAEPDGDGFKPNDYVMVTINLQKARGAVFLRALSDPETSSRYAVMVSLGSERHFCQRSDVTLIMTPAGQSVSFGMKRASGLQSINIAIMVPDKAAPPQAYWMPVIFDLMVKNEGRWAADRRVWMARCSRHSDPRRRRCRWSPAADLWPVRG